MEVTGKVRLINPTQEVSEKFRKREIVVTTDEQYPQHIMIEFTQEKVDLLNAYQPGDDVRVSINLRGREWTNPQGETRYFNSIQGWRIEKAGAAQQPAQGGYAPQGYNQAPPQQGYNNQGYPQSQAPSTPQFNAPTSYKEEEIDDLPF